SPMAATAAAIAKREGLAPEKHLARQLTRKLVRQYDLILVMEAMQKTWIESRYPKSRGRVFLISYWQGGDDIEDPFRLANDVFESVYAQLVSCTDDWCQHLSV